MELLRNPRAAELDAVRRPPHTISEKNIGDADTQSNSSSDVAWGEPSMTESHIEIIWTDYMKYRARLRGFDLAKIEHIVR